MRNSEAMKHIGGKLLVFGACIPSVGELALKSTRDNPRLDGFGQINFAVRVL